MKYQQIDNKNRTFSIRTLLDLKTFDSTKLLGDKQSQEPVKYLFKILEEIPTNTSSQQGIRYYIKFMKKYNDIFTTKNINAEDATKFLLKTISYWETILKNGGCSTQLVDMLRENYNSLYATEEITKIFYGQNLKKKRTSWDFGSRKFLLHYAIQGKSRRLVGLWRKFLQSNKRND
jgi:hypothetical protein